MQLGPPAEAVGPQDPGAVTRAVPQERQVGFSSVVTTTSPNVPSGTGTPSSSRISTHTWRGTTTNGPSSGRAATAPVSRSPYRSITGTSHAARSRARAGG
ncbi:hypothetical protein NKG05_17860 [Oerskovia sp. M15]